MTSTIQISVRKNYVPQINVYNPNFMLEDIRHQGEWSRWEEFKELDRSFKDSVNYPHKNNIWDRQ